MAGEFTNEVVISGPLFDGMAMAEADEARAAALTAVAQRGIEMVRDQFAGSIRRSTGRFLASVRMTPVTRTYTISSRRGAYSMVIQVPPGAVAVTSSRADYGPWLEGTGSRNVTTSFKGYHGFQKAAGQLEQEATGIANTAAAPLIAEMNL